MMMQKEEKMVFVLLLMALGSLAVAFWAFSPDDGGNESFSGSGIQERTEDPGPLTWVEGMIVEIKPTKTGGHLLIKIDSTSDRIFISRNAGAEKLSGDLKKGDRITARGMQRDYQGQKEIEVSRLSDIEIIN
ncbi:MAG: hypothetical protein WBL87_04965 [Methanothrix sp.]